MADDKKPDDPRALSGQIIHSERNLERWAIFGTRNTKVERILERRSRDGELTETCRIGAVGYKGKMRSLTTEHGRMMNLIKALFQRQRPADNWIKISSPEFYDFLIDIASMAQPERRRFRDDNRNRNWVRDLLHVMAATPIMMQRWKKKDGSSMAVERMNLIDGYEIFGLTDHGEWGFIKIKLNAVIADGIRARNTAPILIEIANSIKDDIAWVLYRYLDKVLYKAPVFEIPINSLVQRLAIGAKRQDHLVDQFRTACEKIKGLDITCGRIMECEVYKKGKDWWLKTSRGKRIERKKMKDPVDPKKKVQEENRQFDAYVRRFEAMPEGEEKEALTAAVAAELSKGAVTNPLQPGYRLSREIAIANVMEAYYNRKNDDLVYGLTSNKSQDMVAHEPEGPAYSCDSQRRAIGSLASVLSEYARRRIGQ